MRLAGQEKMGYYPTPLSQVTLIASLLKVEPGKPVRLLDPCVGAGEALEALAQALAKQGAQVETWGVELSPARAEKAAACLDRVLPTAWEQARVRDDPVSLCFLNPPYDFEGLGDSRRQELTFLKSSTPTLVPGGILVYIIPEYVLRRNTHPASPDRVVSGRASMAIHPGGIRSVQTDRPDRGETGGVPASKRRRDSGPGQHSFTSASPCCAWDRFFDFAQDR